MCLLEKELDLQRMSEMLLCCNMATPAHMTTTSVAFTSHNRLQQQCTACRILLQLAPTSGTWLASLDLATLSLSVKDAEAKPLLGDVLKQTQEARRTLEQLKAAEKKCQAAHPDLTREAQNIPALLEKAAQLSLVVAGKDAVLKQLQAEVFLKMQHNELLEGQLHAEEMETLKLSDALATAKASGNQAKQEAATAGKGGVGKKLRQADCSQRR